MRVEGATRGSASPVCISDSTRANRFPNFPPGCKLAKSSSLNPRRSLNATASASPKANIVVVEAVGASPREQASCATEQSRATSAADARVEIPPPTGAPFLARCVRDEDRPEPVGEWELWLCPPSDFIEQVSS